MSSDANKLLSKAKNGSAAAQIELGHNYLSGLDFDGDIFPQDLEQARFWLEQAHEQGAATATFLLGTIFEGGKGVDTDLHKAVHLYECAAEQGAYLPCLHLARIHANGLLETSSPLLAIHWYEKVLGFEGEIDEHAEIEEARKYVQAFRSATHTSSNSEQQGNAIPKAEAEE